MNKINAHMKGLLLVLMLLTQIGIAQHSAVHFADGHETSSFVEVQHDEEDVPHPAAQEICQICLITQQMSFGIVNTQSSISAPVTSTFEPHDRSDFIISEVLSVRYHPRAPPTSLI